MTLVRIEYECDGVALTGYCADGSSGGRAPGVLVAHEAPGMTQLVKARAEALAEQGYVAFALDLHGATDFPLDEARRRHAELMATPGLICRRAAAAFQVLQAHPRADPDRLAAVGFCQGGVTVMELARAGLPLRSVVGFHPGLERPAGSPQEPIRCRILMLVGADDPLAPQEDREAFMAEMRAAGVDWQLHLFGGVQHAFTDPGVDAHGLDGLRYDARASRRAWRIMLDHLAESLN